MECASCFVEIVLCMYFFSAFRERRFSDRITYTAAFGGGSVYALALFLLPAGGSLFAASVAVTLFISFLYRFKWYASVFMTVIISVISGLSELIVMYLVSMSGLNFAQANANDYVYFAGLSATKTFTYIIILMIRKGKHKSLQGLKNVSFFQLLAMPCATVAVSIIFSHLVYYYNVPVLLKILSMIAQIILIIANIMIFNIIDSQYELIQIREKLNTSHILMKNQKQYYEDAFRSQQEIRRTRHDLKNIFIAVLGELNAGHVEETKAMIQNRLDEMEQYIYVDPSDDSVIASVIHSKEMDAKKRGVSLDVRQNINQEIKVDHFDMAVLIANLLDNAIEAADKVADNRTVRFSVITEKENLVVVSENPTVNEINGNELKTTKNDFAGHGFGVMSIRAIAEKYNGSFVWSCKDGLFFATVVLPN